MTEAPLLNDEAARSATGEILDQSTTQALETRRQELETQRTQQTEAQIQASSELQSTTPSEPATTETDDGKTLLTEKKGESPKAPEAYESFKLPEGYTLSPEVIAEVTPVLKDLGLDQAGAQRLVDFHVKQMIEAAKAPQATYETTRTKWQADAKADPEMSAYARDGKTGLDAVKIDLGRAMSVLTPQEATEFKAAMDLTGAGDNPAFIKAFWKLSQRVVEGRPVSGKGPSPLGQVDPTRSAKPSAAQSMYPNLPSAAG